ncbi:helix-turn-helix domain-containing protein [Hyphomonas sp. UBA4494]|jgi:Zn-dependent peptidase ImmA (M78 family)/transcriptional regulator with XRE-family HTH domain|uniref:helix-turn-helix domain-containing protein n=1 Tax=Hyphomonas sp. UBA4494 TaxID=1946631 RepID=UPI0025C13172|nr:XRE family transcriptional regulator [Hyphomonas sp. UBA4494]|eukprot:TRINITY_DN22451_c0_g1_i1.p1 TRINITY_DN22451_c0_g1~~TRINITY_DN22451_c0_g1_i1.p1  ORF type:complete len:389 (+),score=-8.29 TRINITY_DN22451_c0_g1_i1:788-1954(+)
MTVAVGFLGERLFEARKARGLSAVDLGGMVDVSPTSISKYENGHQSPRQSVVSRIAQVLGFPREYFFRPLGHQDQKPVFWRSQLSAPATALDRASVRLDWFKELVTFLGEYFEYPELDILDTDIPEDPNAVTDDMIEALAMEVRNYWGISSGPISDVLEKVEASGILVSRIHVGIEKVDAFSQWSDSFGVPFIVLSRDKASAVRQRFDTLHELYHILAHRNVTPNRLNNRQTYKLLEQQANKFASFMLLPERDFIEELYAPTLDGMLSMKERWGASVATMIMRCRSMDLFDDESARRMWMNYTRRGWRKNEPFDGKIPKEEPHLIRRSIEMLLDNNIVSVSQILKALPFPVGDLEELADLEPGTLGGKPDKRVEPILKSPNNIVSLFN